MWLLVIVLLLFAIGGIFLSKFLFILLLLALLVVFLNRRSTA